MAMQSSFPGLMSGHSKLPLAKLTGVSHGRGVLSLMNSSGRSREDVHRRAGDVVLASSLRRR
jgi:hypothetical protein